jgi:hypothetical protein
MTWLIVCIIVIVISGIIRGVRAANRRQEIAGFQSYAGTAVPTFPLEVGESIVTSLAARDLGAVRRIEGDAIKDDYPSSFPLVACTSARLVIQMSVTDRTTDLSGSFPPRRVDLRRRIGEQFSGTDHRISSCAWPWQSISWVVAEGDTSALLWENERGSGAVLLTFMTLQGQSQFVSTALAAISAARSRLGFEPAQPSHTADGTSHDYSFRSAQTICSDCGTVIDPVERFCTGCGIRVFRLEAAES